jgi:hypothetical protein
MPNPMPKRQAPRKTTAAPYSNGPDQLLLFNMVCFAVGVAFIFLNGTLRVLGISLVVGGLFSFGTFMTQWWDHAWQIENNTKDRAFNFGYHDKRYAELQRLAKEYIEGYSPA